MWSAVIGCGLSIYCPDHVLVYPSYRVPRALLKSTDTYKFNQFPSDIPKEPPTASMCQLGWYSLRLYLCIWILSRCNFTGVSKSGVCEPVMVFVNGAGDAEESLWVMVTRGRLHNKGQEEDGVCISCITPCVFCHLMRYRISLVRVTWWSVMWTFLVDLWSFERDWLGMWRNGGGGEYILVPKFCLATQVRTHYVLRYGLGLVLS